jgi:hypothetical protein
MFSASLYVTLQRRDRRRARRAGTHACVWPLFKYRLFAVMALHPSYGMCCMVVLYYPLGRGTCKRTCTTCVSYVTHNRSDTELRGAQATTPL